MKWKSGKSFVDHCCQIIRKVRTKPLNWSWWFLQNHQQLFGKFFWEIVGVRPCEQIIKCRCSRVLVCCGCDIAKVGNLLRSHVGKSATDVSGCRQAADF